MDHMKKVLLLSPPSRSFNHYRPPLALMYLSGYLKHNGIPSKIIDINIKQQVRNRKVERNYTRYLREVEDKVVEKVKGEETDIIGITCYTPELEEVERLVKRIRYVNPGVKVVVGGIHPTLYPEHFLGPESPFDFAVIGEGELTLLDLVRAIRSGEQYFSTVHGIGYFDRASGKNVITPPQELAHNLDDIAFPDYEDLDMAYYTNASPYVVRGVFLRGFYILSSRGCP